MVETGLNSVVVNGRGKLPRFTQACGNRRFTTSDDAGARGIPGSPIRRREWRYRRHFWHDGSALSTPARAGRRARTASRQPPWVRPGLGPRYGFSALPWNSVVSPPAKQRRLVALHSWGFLRAIGPAVATRPPARSPVLRARGSGRPARSSNSTPSRRSGSSSTRVGSLGGNYRL